LSSPTRCDVGSGRSPPTAGAIEQTNTQFGELARKPSFAQLDALSGGVGGDRQPLAARPLGSGWKCLQKKAIALRWRTHVPREKPAEPSTCEWKYKKSRKFAAILKEVCNAYAVRNLRGSCHRPIHRRGGERRGLEGSGSARTVIIGRRNATILSNNAWSVSALACQRR